VQIYGIIYLYANTFYIPTKIFHKKENKCCGC